MTSQNFPFNTDDPRYGIFLQAGKKHLMENFGLPENVATVRSQSLLDEWLMWEEVSRKMDIKMTEALKRLLSKNKK